MSTPSEDQRDEGGLALELRRAGEAPRRRRTRSPGPASPGRRTRRRRRRRRRAILRAGGLVGLIGLLAVGVVALAVGLRGSDQPAPEGQGEPGAAAPVGDRQPTLLVVTFDEAAPDEGATLLMVLAHDVETDEATVVLVPTTAVADVPGHGLLQLGRAYSFGRGPLLDATLDNLLGVDLDHVAEISRQGWASLLTRVGGLTVELPSRLVERRPDGSGQVRFQPGEQFLDGPRLAELLTFSARSESELDRFPRVQVVLRALFDALARDPDLLEAIFVDGAPMLDTTAEPAAVRSLLDEVADAHADDRLVVRTLPVTPIGSGDDNSYRVDGDRAERLVEEHFAASMPDASDSGGRSLQILNGNGTPGIGQQVASRLLPAGFRVVLTGNADSFDHDTTRVLVYEDTPEQLARAREIVRRLGVGRVEISQTPQSVVDITVVVGDDFPPGNGAGGGPPS